MSPKRCYLCGSTALNLVHTVTRKPDRETDFGIPAGAYSRQIFRCERCAVYNNYCDFDFGEFYSSSYTKATYGTELLDRYRQVMDLPYEKSDNKHRVQRISTYCQRRGKSLQHAKVLDVGSGLCVLSGELLKVNPWAEVTCVDPDPRSIEHARANVGVQMAFLGAYDRFKAGPDFDLIALNKVLEHVPDPVAFLEKTASLINDGGIVYVELPDGDSALNHGLFDQREEFFIEHLTVFNPAALDYLVNRTDLHTTEAGQIHEPSDKYTLYAFLEKALHDAGGDLWQG